MSALNAMEPRLIRSFIVVAEELHFGRAAARLHISQPPLSMQIRALEERLGARLFDRDRRHVALTEAGAFFLDRARRLLADAERCCAETKRIADGRSGVLSVGYTATATYRVLPPVLREFRKRTPDVRLELIELRSGLQAEAIHAGRIEVGFACGPVGRDGIEERVLTRERFIAALPRRHPLCVKKQLRSRDLARRAVVAVRPDVEPAWANACTAALRRARVELDVVEETDTKLAMLGLVAAGTGLAIVSESMRCLAREGVVFKEIVDLGVEVPLVALHLERPSPRAQMLLALCPR